MTEEDNKMTEEYEEQENYDEHHHKENKEHYQEHEEQEHYGEHHHEEEKKLDTMTVSKITIWKGVAGVLTVLLIMSVFTGGFGLKSESILSGAVVKEAQPAQAAQPAQQRQAAPSNEQPTAIDMAALSDDDAFKGDKNTPVTIIEWSDFECPFCGRFYTQTLPSIQKEYIDTGKVKLIYRDFPLSFHANAQKAAEAAECADEQGKFWEMHDKLFEEGVQGGVDSFKQSAKDMGLNTGKFDECLDSGKMASEIAKDTQDGQAAGISGTPGFIINGKLIVGAQPFENFKQAIDAELAK